MTLVVVDDERCGGRCKQRAQTEKPPVQRAADRVTTVFVPIVLVMAIVDFFIWFTLAYTGTVEALPTSSVRA